MNGIFYISTYAKWQETGDENLPSVSFIPPLMRRRLTDVEKIGMYLADNVCGGDRNDYQTVFASRYGEWRQTVKLIEQFHFEGEMSPAGFSSSVHNAMPGFLSIFSKNTNSYTTVAAGELTINNALLEAFCGKNPCLFIYAEEHTPELYVNEFKDCLCGHGLAFMFSSEENTGMKISVKSEYSKGVICNYSMLSDFLKNGGELITEHLKIRSI